MIARKPRPQKDSGYHTYHRRKMSDILEHALKMADDSQEATSTEGFWLSSEKNERYSGTYAENGG